MLANGKLRAMSGNDASGALEGITAMAIGQVTVPHLPGYAFGVGADLATGSPMGKVVTGPEKSVQRAAGATITFDVQRIQSTEELERALGIDAEASYGSGCFGPKVSARFSYAKRTKVQSSSLFMLVSTRVDLAFLSIDEPVLSQDAQGLVSNPAAFKARYGNMFVRGIGRGGLFVGTIRMETKSSEQSQQIAAELEGSYGLFSASVQSKFSEAQKKYKTSTFINMYHEGGPIDLKITDLANPLELLNNANRFLDSFNTDPDKFAWPYFVTLAPIAIAQGPLPPNSADLEHAQDVLVACSKARSRNLDKVTCSSTSSTTKAGSSSLPAPTRPRCRRRWTTSRRTSSWSPIARAPPFARPSKRHSRRSTPRISARFIRRHRYRFCRGRRRQSWSPYRTFPAARTGASATRSSVALV
jgi:hypothetical protein